eukprot:CAMPEP_0195308118 /NCGR_PEP_ID=MMETSP0707-20130614/38061_1 /TAXON_ID=33640 /ORGANISM="Asterionellopsis glacialis, Strain CCMP134" /LENGTH=564 /DNA_ID=CAMNT_0040372377 /DNA_START=439 /DNA_END=2129 /DNA_ORIENTATION=-
MTMNATLESANLMETWKSILLDTPPRLNVDFRSVFLGEGPLNVKSVIIDNALVSNVQAFCARNKLSTETFVLEVLHQTLRAYSHESFCIGMCQKGGNIILVPFKGTKNGGMESLQAVHNRWTNKILPYSETPYDEIKTMGYGCNVTLSINQASNQDFEGYCQRQRISLFTLALSVMHKSLHAYSHDAFAIGTAFDARPSYFHDTVGMFVNTVLIPFGTGKEDSKETLKQLNDRWINQILPLATVPFDLVSAAGYGSNLYLAFNVGIIDTCDGAPKEHPLPELQKGIGYAAPTAKFDLSVDWTECSSGDGSIVISFESGIGPWPDIEDRFNHIISQILTTQAQSSPSTPLFIDNLLPQEKERVLKLARGPEDPIIDCCLHELVEKQVRKRPDAIALLNKSGTEKMTYAELDAQAHRLAVELQRRGAKPNSYVGILMGEKTFEMHVAVLGVLKSGAAYVPMDAVLFPPERIKFIAEDTDMKLLVTVGEHVDLVDGRFEKVLVEEAVKNTSHDGMHLERLVKPSDCAYMIYTSGTTGVPKGVACHHIGPVNMIFYESGVDIFRKGTP